MKTREIPSLESASPEFARLSAQQTDLANRGRAIDAEILELHSKVGEVRRDASHVDRLSAILAGANYEPAPDIRDEIAQKYADRRAIENAISDVTRSLAVERTNASKIVADKFADERLAWAKEFYGLIAKAAAIHAEYGEMQRQFRRAGIEPFGAHDFGRELFGEPGQRNGDLALALRGASRRGYLKESEIPEAFR